MVHIIFEDEYCQYQVLSKETLKGGLNVMRKSFYIDENVSIAVELHKYPNAIKELQELSVRAANDGASIVAVEKTSGLVVGVALNKMQIKGKPGDDTYFEKFAASCKEPASKALVMFMKEADEACDLFTRCRADCLLELMFLAILSDHRGKGIATKLCEATVKLGKLLLDGKNIKQSLTEETLPLEPRPKAITALYTSFISQKIAKRLGFVTAMEISFNRWSFDGKTFAERIGPSTPNVTVEYKCL